ncbi:MAG: tetratricopeptide repeat protein [Pirellulaceae bacterium]|nr:tetratricopeptide repeat protein [Pirellulaceae bacterium]
MIFAHLVRKNYLSLVALIALIALTSTTIAQTTKTKPGSVQGPVQKSTPPRKLTEAEKAAQAVLNAYTDAANFQNSGSYALAIEAWEKLLKSFPNDPLASKARHYLGLCYLRRDKADYETAIKYLRAALEDRKLEVREESLVELGRALSQSAMQTDASSKKKKLEEASKVFAAFLESYADGSYADQALFSAGEAEYQLGRYERAANYYRRLTDSNQPAMTKSALRPDALFSLGVVYEELKQNKLAMEAYEAFFKNYSKNRLANDVRLRLAEQYLALNKPTEAVELFAKASQEDNRDLQDYVLYRYGYALAKAGKFAESSKVYKELGEKFPQSPYASGSALAAGQALMRDKNFDQAAVYFKKLLANRDETASEAAHLLCQIAMMQGKAESAVPIARDALEWSASSPRFIALKMDLADGLASNQATLAEAKSMYEQIAVEHNDDAVAPRAAYNAAFSALQSGQLADAKRWSELFAKQYPQDALSPDVAYIYAESTLQLGQFAEAATAFEQLIAGQKDNPLRGAWELRLGHARFMAGDLDKAISQMMALAKDAKEKTVRAEAYFLIGASLMKQEKFSEAESALQRSLETAPNWSQADEALLVLAQAQLRGEKSKDAKKTLAKLLKDYPNSRFKQQAEFRVGQISASLGEFDQAISSYDSVLESNQGKNVKEVAAYGKAWVLMQKQDYQAAIELLKPLTQSDRQDAIAAEARLAHAICLRNTKKAAEAVADLERLVNEPSPAVPQSKALYELGLTFIELKEHKKASQVFNRLLSEFPKLDNMDKILYEYAWALKAQGSLKESADVFAKLSSAYPDSQLAAEADYYLGQGAYEEKKFDRAVVAYTSAVTRTKDAELQEKSLYKLGWAYYQQNDFEQAAAQFAKQNRDFPKSPLSIEALFMQGECMMKKDQFAQAFELYKQARKSIDSLADSELISEQVRTLTYIHGAQSARELQKWEVVDEWLGVFFKKFPESNQKPYALYESAFSAQSRRQPERAVKLYTEVAESNRNEIGARARFMIGELYFAERDYAKAITEFERVVYGFGASQAPDDVKNWQARASIEAGRCSEVLIGKLNGSEKAAAVRMARKFYDHVVKDHPTHPLVAQAEARIEVLEKL